MNIRSYSSDSYHLFQVFGSLGLQGIEEFSEKFEESIVSYRQQVVFDFRETTSVDAGAVRYLERFSRALNSMGKSLYFVSLGGQPAEMLDLLCFVRNIVAFPSVESFRSNIAENDQISFKQSEQPDSELSHSIVMLAVEGGSSPGGQSARQATS